MNVKSYLIRWSFLLVLPLLVRTLPVKWATNESDSKAVTNTTTSSITLTAAVDTSTLVTSVPSTINTTSSTERNKNSTAKPPTSKGLSADGKDLFAS